MPMWAPKCVCVWGGGLPSGHGAHAGQAIVTLIYFKCNVFLFWQVTDNFFPYSNDEYQFSRKGLVEFWCFNWNFVNISTVFYIKVGYNLLILEFNPQPLGCRSTALPSGLQPHQNVLITNRVLALGTTNTYKYRGRTGRQYRWLLHWVAL